MTPPKLLLRASLQMSRSPKQPRSPKFPLRTVSLRPVDASPSTASPNGNNYSPAPAGLTVKEAIVMRTVNPSPLTERRIALGLTQAQLAEKSHINIRQVQKIEKGESDLGNITFTNAAHFAAALDLSIDQLAKYML